jgi:hypothetical protein
MSLIGEGLLANLMAIGLSACIFFFIFTKAGVPYSKEYLRNLISRFCGWLVAAVFMSDSAWFAGGGDGGPSPEGEGRGIIGFGQSIGLAMRFTCAFKSIYVIIIGKCCPVCRPNLYPLGWTRRHGTGKYSTRRYGAGRHANGGESHGNQQQSTHK